MIVLFDGINRLVFVIEIVSVYCEVRPESLNVLRSLQAVRV